MLCNCWSSNKTKRYISSLLIKNKLATHESNDKELERLCKYLSTQPVKLPLAGKYFEKMTVKAANKTQLTQLQIITASWADLIIVLSDHLALWESNIISALKSTLFSNNPKVNIMGMKLYASYVETAPPNNTFINQLCQLAIYSYAKQQAKKFTTNRLYLLHMAALDCLRLSIKSLSTSLSLASYVKYITLSAANNISKPYGFNAEQSAALKNRSCHLLRLLSTYNTLASVRAIAESMRSYDDPETLTLVLNELLSSATIQHVQAYVSVFVSAEKPKTLIAATKSIVNYLATNSGQRVSNVASMLATGLINDLGASQNPDTRAEIEASLLFIGSSKISEISVESFISICRGVIAEKITHVKALVLITESLLESGGFDKADGRNLSQNFLMSFLEIFPESGNLQRIYWDIMLLVLSSVFNDHATSIKVTSELAKRVPKKTQISPQISVKYPKSGDRGMKYDPINKVKKLETTEPNVIAAFFNYNPSEYIEEELSDETQTIDLGLEHDKLSLMVKYLSNSDDLRLVTFGKRIDDHYSEILAATASLKEIIPHSFVDSGVLIRSQYASIYKTIHARGDSVSSDREAFMRVSIYLAHASSNGYSYSICEVIRKLYHHYEAKFPSYCIAFLLLLPESVFVINSEICNFFSKIFSLEELDGKFSQKSFREVSSTLTHLCNDQERVDLINKINSAAFDISLLRLTENNFDSNVDKFDADFEYSESDDSIEPIVVVEEQVSEEMSDLVSQRMMTILEERNYE